MARTALLEFPVDREAPNVSSDVITFPQNSRTINHKRHNLLWNSSCDCTRRSPLGKSFNKIDDGPSLYLIPYFCAYSFDITKRMQIMF